MTDKYKDILILSDIDGTLVHGGELSEKTIDAVKSFEMQGGKFSIASGRTVQYIKENYASVLPINCPVAAVNGAVIADVKDMKLLHGTELPTGFERLIYRVWELCTPMRTMTYTFSDMIKLFDGFEKTLPKACYKILVVTETEKEACLLRDAIRKEFGKEYDCVRSWNTGVEIMSKSTGKGKSLEIIKKMCGAKIAIGIGDYENDITLLKSADIGIATGNAIEELKEIADVITVESEQSPVAHVIKNLDKIIGESYEKL